MAEENTSSKPMKQPVGTKSRIVIFVLTVVVVVIAGTYIKKWYDTVPLEQVEASARMTQIGRVGTSDQRSSEEYRQLTRVAQSEKVESALKKGKTYLVGISEGLTEKAPI